MAFIYEKMQGRNFNAGEFLADNEHCTRLTMNISASLGEEQADGSKVVKGGTKLDGVGVVYEDVDVTNGDAAGSVVTAGIVYAGLISGEGELPDTITAITYPTVTRG